MYIFTAIDTGIQMRYHNPIFKNIIMAKSYRKRKKKQKFLLKNLEFWVVSLSIFLLFLGVLFRAYSFSGTKQDSKRISERESSPLALCQDNSLISLSPTVNPPLPPLEVVEELPVVITAYSSTPSQTDDTPHITASGSGVKDGVVANNLLPFGTHIRIPEVFGDKIFVVEDRMNWKKGYYMVDVWLPDYNQALAFGAKSANMEILGR